MNAGRLVAWGVGISAAFLLPKDKFTKLMYRFYQAQDEYLRKQNMRPYVQDKTTGRLIPAYSLGNLNLQGTQDTKRRQNQRKT